MNKLRAALAAAQHKLGVDKLLWTRARQRHHRQLRKEQNAHATAVAAQAAADDARKTNPAEATKQDRRAHRALAREQRHRAKRIYLRTLVRKRAQQVNEIETSVAAAQKALDDAKAKHKVTIRGNKATGGTRRGRVVALAVKSWHACAAAARRNFYSQSGALDLDHPVTGESYGERSDCSSWDCSLDKNADCPDPTKTGWGAHGPVYTGTIESGCVQVARGKQQPGDHVLYGRPGATHHVERYIGLPGVETIGHGSAPVDPGVVDLFNDGEYRFFRSIR